MLKQGNIYRTDTRIKAWKHASADSGWEPPEVVLQRNGAGVGDSINSRESIDYLNKNEIIFTLQHKKRNRKCPNGLENLLQNAKLLKY